MGSKAKDLLALPEFSGRVLAVLSDTIYLSTREGEIFWICPERSPLHRRCILVSLPPKVVSGEECFWQCTRLTFSGGPFIDLRTAREWSPSGAGTRKSASLAGLWVCFRRLLGVLNLLEVREGMGRAISLVRALAEGRTLPAFPPTSIMGRVQEMALELAHACLDRDFPSVTRKGKEMIGLGPGLTPSGDDFLGGLFFAARSLHQAYPEEFRFDEEAVLELLGWAKTRTHPISRAIFSDLALGHGPEPLHDLIDGLLEGRDLDPVLEAALRLTAIGHSSGWDMLAGAVTGMLMAKKSIEHRAQGGRAATEEFYWDTDTHGSFLKKKTETERQSYSSAKPRSKGLILTARQFQKSPLRPPFLKGGWGGFQRRVSHPNMPNKIQRV